MSDGANGSDGRQSRPVLNSLRDFLHDEAAGGVVLLIATVVALVWANSAASESYEDFWHHVLTLGTGWWAVSEDLEHWVNDGLMVIFFFVVGLEIKRELVVGELRSPRAAALPAIAALGGAVLPALVFLLIVGNDARNGWGIPMATDIAFAVGMLALLGRRATDGAKLFLLSVAIVDDLIAIVVIALFYSDHLSLGWFAVSLGALGLIVLMRFSVTSPWLYVVPGIVVWFALLQSGVHATLAGVALGLLTPARPVRGRPVLDELEHRLHPISVFVVVPVFALANAGIPLGGGALTDAFGTRLTWAIAAGLVVGKLVGIALATWLALKLRIGELPADMVRREIWPLAALGGIGFTVALFITDLAFKDEALVDDAKVGVFAGSIVAAVIGGLLLRVYAGRPKDDVSR